MIETEVLIVGSGPAGINAAWPLVLAGINVVMIDADNRSLPLPPDSNIGLLRNNKDRWKYSLGEDLGGLFLQGDHSPKLATPLASAVINAGVDMAPKIRSNNFMAMKSATPGGLSSIWGAFCSAYDSSDMASYAISSSEMDRAYRAVALRIGISGANDHLADFHGADLPLQEPVPLTAPASHLLQRYLSYKATKGFTLGLARNAVITREHKGRKECNQCGLCLLGCVRKSIYNSAYELSELKKHANFSYRSDAPLKRLISIGGETQIVEIAEKVTIKSKRLLLAAGTINTTSMILEYAGMFGMKLRMLSNPVAGMAFIVPGLVGSKYQPKSFSLGQLSYSLNMEEENEYATGVVYGADTLPLDVFARRMPFSRPLSMRLSAMLAPALLPVTAYLPGRYSLNSISLEKRGDNTEVVLNGYISNDAKQQLKRVGKRLGHILKRYGAYLVPGSLTISPPGSDAHLVGTIPMGGNGELSCSNTCELNIATGVHLIDGSWLPELPAKHCTFTIMANAYRVGTLLVEQLQSEAK